MKQMIFTVAFLAYSFLAINGQNVFKCFAHSVGGRRRVLRGF